MHTKTHKENHDAENAIPAAAPALRLQAKLSIGAVNDPLEHEADAMADKVMRMQEVPAATATGTGIQRKCAGCEEEEKVQRKPLASFIQRKESSAGTVASDAVSNKINASKGFGSSMDRVTQSFMQSRFGADFSDVKIHTGGEAIQMNRELNAKAFTVGNNIYFNEGQYDPGSKEGKHLLAHELTHTVQQGGEDKLISKTTDPCTYPGAADKDREIHLNLGLSSVRVYTRTASGSTNVQFNSLILGSATSALASQNGWCRMYSIQNRTSRSSGKGLLNFVNYCGDFGFHSNFWQPTSGGSVTRIPGAQSHGCARLHDTSGTSTATGDSRAFFDAVRVGDCVRIYQRDFWRTPTFKHCTTEGADCTTRS